MTMTDEEKAQARATDPLAAEIIDRCDAMSPEAMQRLHGVLRDPHAAVRRLVPEVPDGVDWWDPLADNAVRPDVDAVLVERGDGWPRQPGAAAARAGAPTRRTSSSPARPRGSPRCTPTSTATPTSAVVVDDDPAADLHEWYGRYLYFAPDELEPLGTR